MKMVNNLLQIGLSAFLVSSHIFFGSEVEITDISFPVYPVIPTAATCEKSFCRLQTFYKKNGDQAARLLVHDRENVEKVVKLSNFKNYYNRLPELKSSVGVGYNGFYVICCDQEAFHVSHIDDVKQPEELLNLKACFVRLQRNCVVLETINSPDKIYNQQDIQQLRNLLQKGIPFVVDFGYDSKFKILEFKNDSYFWWNGWIPRFDWPTEITQLDQMGVPKSIQIDRVKNIQAHNGYQFRQFWINSLFALISGALVIYLMGDHLKSFPLKIK